MVLLRTSLLAGLVLGGCHKRRQVAASGADHELANPAHGVDLAVGVLRREALVGVVVPGQNQVGVGVIEGW